MKRLGNLWHQIVSFENFYLAYRKAKRGKQHKASVAQFTLNLEVELLRLQQEVVDNTYQPGEYRLFTIYERKPRQIAAAPFRDRVLHHALLNIVEPLLDRQFIDDSYACRKNKGVHKAVARYQQWAKRYRYALKMDIAQYFPSINRPVLKDKIQRYIKDKQVLNLFNLIIDNAPTTQGIPIGNLTSQFLANLYLDDFDHYLKEKLQMPAYLRYVDDFVVLGDDKNILQTIKLAVKDKLAQDLLLLHPRKAHITPTSDGLDLLGYQVFPHFRRLRSDNIHRFNRKLHQFAKQYAEGQKSWVDFNPSIQSWIGHASHADTMELRKKIFSDIVFLRS